MTTTRPAKTAAYYAAELGKARELMQVMIASGFGVDTRERQERRINRLKAKMAASVTEETAVTSTEDRIIAAISDLAAQRNDLVSLARVRSAIADIPRDEQDRALKAMDRARVIGLDPEPNRKTLPANVAEWALRVGPEDKHLVYLV